MRDKLIESFDLAKEVAFDINEGNFYNFVVVRLFFLESLNVEHADEYFFNIDEPEETSETCTKLMTDLFDLSMTWRIQKTFKRMQELPSSSILNRRFRHGYYVLGYRLFLERSEDGQTNITPEIVESLGNIYKREDERNGI